VSLPPELREALASFAAREQILVGTDFDGVLAPLVPDPSKSRPVDGSMELLRELADAPGVFVAIVSGRQLTALKSRTGVGAAEPIVLIGSHGAEPNRELALDLTFDDAARTRLERATAALAEVVDAHPPTCIERKPAGVVLHTRNVPVEVAQAATAAALAIDLPGVDVMKGKQIVELSVLSVTKGGALEALARQFGTEATLYLGDDVTDERAFTVLGEDDRNMTVKVGAGDTAASFRIEDPAAVVQVLRALRDARLAAAPSHG
jgi:trehalose-phosphatase